MSIARRRHVVAPHDVAQAQAEAPSATQALYRRISFYELMELLSFGQLALVQGHLPSAADAVAVGWSTWQDVLPGADSWRGMEGARQVVLVSSAQALLRSSFPGAGAQVSVAPVPGPATDEWRYAVRGAASRGGEPEAGWRVPVDLGGLLSGVLLAPDAPDRYVRLVAQQVHQRVWVPVHRVLEEAPEALGLPAYDSSLSMMDASRLVSSGGSHR